MTIGIFLDINLSVNDKFNIHRVKPPRPIIKTRIGCASANHQIVIGYLRFGIRQIRFDILRNSLIMFENEEESTLKFARLSENARTPVKGSDKAAGFDLSSAYNYCVPARGKELINTDLQIELPSGCYGRIAPRSGLAWKNFIDVGAGVIDEDYRGNVGVLLFNHSDSDFLVKKGDRVAQLICERIFHPKLKEIQNLSETERGTGGFGSTGVSSNVKS